LILRNKYTRKVVQDIFPLSSHRPQQLYRTESPNSPAHPVTAAALRTTIKETSCRTLYIKPFEYFICGGILWIWTEPSGS